VARTAPQRASHPTGCCRSRVLLNHCQGVIGGLRSLKVPSCL
jgi:hypothetical protein